MKAVREVGGKLQRFKVLAHLGSGGMGTVVRAHDPTLERDVAIKLLGESNATTAALSKHETIDLRTAPTPRGSKDLLHEARMMARLSHPNLLPVYEVGLDDTNRVFLVMEHIDGADLRAWAPGRSRRAIVEVLVQAGHGLAAAHAEGVVHGDFKPENVLIGRDGRVRVGDFGLAQLRSHDSRGVHVGGTPGYMAPEVENGDAPTRASDVYAYCVTVAEALGAKVGNIARTLDVPKPLHSAILAGLVERPEERASLGEVVRALSATQSPKRRWRWVLAGAGAAAAIGAAAVLALDVADRGTPSCEATVWPARFDATRRADLQRALEPETPGPLDDERIRKVIASFAEIQDDLDVRKRGACRASTDQLTANQTQTKLSCLERRQLELGLKVDGFIKYKPKRLALVVDAARISEVSDCDTVTAPPLGNERTAIVALWGRWMAVGQVPPPQRIEQLRVIARDALALGEREIEINATLFRGLMLMQATKIAEADQLLERAYQLAVEAHSDRLQAQALSMRTTAATWRGDQQAAVTIGNLALALADRPSTAPVVRAQIYLELGTAANERGESAVALALLDKGLAVAAADPHSSGGTEAGLRSERVRALARDDSNKVVALEAAQDGAEWVARERGERSKEYVTAMSRLSSMLRWNGDLAGALATQRKAVELSTQLDPNDPKLWLTKGDLAYMLEVNGKYKEAYKLYADELAAAKQFEIIRKNLPMVTTHVGVNLCALGKFKEGIPYLEKGVDLAIEQHGLDNFQTAHSREELAWVQLELGQLDAAARNINEIVRIYGTNPKQNQRALASMGMMTAPLALARGNAAEAETLIRKSVVGWKEVGGDDIVRAMLLSTLGDVLVERKKYKEARAAGEEVLKIRTETKQRDDSIASAQLLLARIDAAEGKKAAARARAKKVLVVLDRYPAQLKNRAYAEAILGKQAAKRKRR